jgi:hypothetical protein
MDTSYHYPKPGDKVQMMESMGEFIGTCVYADHFVIALGSDTVWVQNTGVGLIGSPNSNRPVTQCHRAPNIRFFTSACRWWRIWETDIPKP